MSIFPDDDKKRRRDDDLADDERRPRDYPAPKPNPDNAFEGGAIREDMGKIRVNRKPEKTEKAWKNVKNKKDVSGVNGLSRGCGWLLAIVIIAAVCLPLFFFVAAPMLGLFNLYGEDTREVPGDAAAFDPIASYAEIAAYAQGEASEVQFVDMDAYYVKSDGTLDLNAAYRPRVSWTFTIAAPRPEDAPPVGAGGSPTDRYFQTVSIDAFEPGQLRSVSRTSGGVRTEYTYKHLGLSRDVDDPSTSHSAPHPAPACSFKTLWSTAIERGAPPDAVAIITYDGEYDFWIQDTEVRLEFDADCKVIQ